MSKTGNKWQGVKPKNVLAFTFHISKYFWLLLQHNCTYHHSPINVEQQNLQFMKISLEFPELVKVFVGDIISRVMNTFNQYNSY